MKSLYPTSLWPRVALAAAMLTAPIAAAAYTVSPLNLAITPAGSGATARVTVTNTDASPITLSVSALKLAVGDDGKVARTPAGGELTAFPPRVILQPGKAQAIQVRYTGPATPQGRLYGVYVKQEPVSRGGGGQVDLKFGIDFMSVVTVQPADAKPSLAASSIAMDPATSRYVMRVANTGAGVGRMGQAKWQIRTAGGLVDLPPAALDGGESSIVMPGQTRAVSIKPEYTAKLNGATAVVINGGEGQ